MTNIEIKDNLKNILLNVKECAIFFLNDSNISDEYKIKLKLSDVNLQSNFTKESFYEIFSHLIEISEKLDYKFNEYLFRLDKYGYNITHYLSCLSKILF
jgi:hypothetical protein